MGGFRDVVHALEAHSKADPIEAGRLRSEPLAEPVFYEGRQWAVTAHGVECRDGTYHIEAKRLWEEEGKYGWIRHMAEKEWCDIEDFILVLSLARLKHQKLCPYGQ